jgi:PAS domain S-box-containing protein
MDVKLTGVRGFNRLLAALIAVQILILLLVIVLLILPQFKDMLSVTSLVSAASLMILCLPLSFNLCLLSQDRKQKLIFLSLFISFAILTVSGIIWYIAPAVFNVHGTVPAAKVCMVFGMVPVIVTLLYILKGEWKAIDRRMKALIISVNAIPAAIIVFFSVARMLESGSDTFNIFIYAVCVVSDILILSSLSVLALAFMKNQLRYALWILLIYSMINLTGDSLNLIGFAGAFATTGYSQFFYDLSYIFTAAALLIYTLSRIEVTTVEEVDKKLRDTRSMIYDLIMQSPDAICIFDAGGEALIANSPFRQLAGEQPSQVPGKFNIFQDTCRLTGGPENLARIRDGESIVYDFETAAGLDGGLAKYYQVKAFPAFDADRKITGYILMMVDITDRRKREEELDRAKTQAELYIDLMGHDINNMNQIGIGFLELALSRMNLDNEWQMMIRKPLEAMQNSSHLIDNVKKIRRADIGSFTLEPLDLGNMLGEVIRDYNAMPGRDTMIEYAPVQGYYVLANLLLKDVFSNLIDNSFKHSTGPLKMWIKMSPVNYNGLPHYRIVIEDNGPGIPQDARRVLLEQAYSFRKRASGRGLGLYLVKVLVDSYKGIITVEDRDPGLERPGTRITILLPATNELLATGSAQPAQPSEISSPPG